MSEADIIEIYATARANMDAAFAQLIALNFALIIGVYYFIHKSRLVIKLAIFMIYLLGWVTFASSAVMSGVEIEGAGRDLALLEDAGPVSLTTRGILEIWRSQQSIYYLIALNAVNLLLVISAFFVLFFWKPRTKEELTYIKRFDR
ncbi:MAG: hypothetical protein AAF225_11375 [Pseudomonadota bacterium]